MKSPGINDYLRILQQKKQEGHDRGEKWIEISSKELHQEVSPEHATMPTCCQAIYKLLYQGDEILQRPKGQTGFGSHLRVRYYVDNLTDREVMFPPKKRGRPAKRMMKAAGIRKICGGFWRPGLMSAAGRQQNFPIRFKLKKMILPG